MRQWLQSPLLLRCALLWLAGVGLRVTILAVPPVITLIHSDLRLTETQVGILIGLPSLLFAVAAVPGSLLIARLGARRVLIAGMLLNGIAAGLRGAAPDVGFLYGMTILMGTGVSIAQPTLPPLVQAWMPNRITLGTALFSNGILVGGILTVTLTIPWLLPLVGGSWRWSFVPSSAAAVLIALPIGSLAPRPRGHDAPRRNRAWWPDWRDPLVWQLGLILGTTNSIYFAFNAFLPDYLTTTGQGELVGTNLIAINLGQLAVSMWLLLFAGRLDLRAWPLVVSGLGMAAGAGAILFVHGNWTIFPSALLGATSAVILILGLALPALLSAPQDTHRLAAGMFTISYGCAVALPILSGLAWDVTGRAAAAFLPMIAFALALLWLAPAALGRRGRRI
jgi:MFS transporter, CP family, cyanate transporter